MEKYFLNYIIFFFFFLFLTKSNFDDESQKKIVAQPKLWVFESFWEDP